ncbi:MAG: 30S ribosomal protein S2 [Bacilli bacterium]|nr:30S ribosomal protein S2 [Bacilli bacterium]
MEAVISDPKAPVLTILKCLEAGVHFGHQTRKWNPKMKKFIYAPRNGIYIIDLEKTCQLAETAYKAMKEIVDNGGKVLFVGTKKQCVEAVEAEALRSGSFYITNRWLGGTLTNFKTIQGRIKYLKELERREEAGELDLLPKLEAAQLRKEKEKLSKNLEGIKEMRKVPNALFVVDPSVEYNAVHEAKKLGIPVFAIIDTNSDPDMVDYPIPANDDAIRSVSLILAVIADAIVESKGGLPVVAYTKDDAPEATMKDVIKQTDKENAEKLARIRAERAARQEAFEKEQAAKAAFREKRAAAKEAAAKEEAVTEEVKAEEEAK